MSNISHVNDYTQEGDWKEYKSKKALKKEKKIKTSEKMLEPSQIHQSKDDAPSTATIPPLPQPNVSVPQTQSIPSQDYLKWHESMKINNTYDPSYTFYNVCLLSNYYNVIFIEHFKNEINTPMILRFKNDAQKKNELGNFIFNFITTNIPTILNNYEITSKIIETYSIIDCYNLIINKDELIKVINKTSELFKTEPVKTEPVKTEPVKTEPVKTEPVKTEPVKTEPVKTEPVKTEPVKTKTVKLEVVKPKNKDEFVNKKNNLLLEAQEDFFQTCIPSEEKINSVKTILELNPKKAIIANTISLEHDIIKKGDFSFSKRHYLGNAYFTNKVIKEYVRIFGDSYWVKLIPNLKDFGKLIIMLDINHKKKEES